MTVAPLRTPSLPHLAVTEIYVVKTLSNTLIANYFVSVHVSSLASCLQPPKQWNSIATLSLELPVANQLWDELCLSMQTDSCCNPFQPDRKTIKNDAR